MSWEWHWTYWSKALWFLISEHDFQCILFAKSAQINFSRRILGESFQHTEKIAVHNSLQNDSHKNQVLGEQQREAGQAFQTKVAFHQSSVSRAEKNSSCFIQNISHYHFVLNRLSIPFTQHDSHTCQVVLHSWDGGHHHWFCEAHHQQHALWGRNHFISSSTSLLSWTLP